MKENHGAKKMKQWGMLVSNLLATQSSHAPRSQTKQAHVICFNISRPIRKAIQLLTSSTRVGPSVKFILCVFNQENRLCDGVDDTFNVISTIKMI